LMAACDTPTRSATSRKDSPVALRACWSRVWSMSGFLGVNWGLAQQSLHSMKIFYIL
jgi:hypothetical protein